MTVKERGRTFEAGGRMYERQGDGTWNELRMMLVKRPDPLIVSHLEEAFEDGCEYPQQDCPCCGTPIMSRREKENGKKAVGRM